MQDGTTTRGPWSPAATLGWASITAVVFVIAQLIVTGIAVVAEATASGVDTADTQAVIALAETVAGNGVVLGMAAVASGVLGSLLILLAVKLRRGPALAEYLDLKPVRPLPLLAWLGVTVLIGLLYELVWPLLGAESVPEFMAEAARTGGRNPFFWLGIVVAAPVFEELMCRGFLLTGWSRSRLGPWGAVVLISVLWAVAHLQYGWQEMSWIVLAGVLLGWARLRTGSLWTPVAMHVLMNLLATIQAVSTVR